MSTQYLLKVSSLQWFLQHTCSCQANSFSFHFIFLFADNIAIYKAGTVIFRLQVTTKTMASSRLNISSQRKQFMGINISTIPNIILYANKRSRRSLRSVFINFRCYQLRFTINSYQLAPPGAGGASSSGDVTQYLRYRPTAGHNCSKLLLLYGPIVNR